MIFGRPYDGIVAGIIVFLIVYPFCFRNNSFCRNICMASLFIYIGSLISITMIYAPPWNWNISTQATSLSLSNINFVPFKESMQIYKNCTANGNYYEFIRLVGGNFIMLMPLGILLPLLFSKFNLIKIFLVASLTSLAIELFQLSTNILLGRILRTVEIDDFIQNVSGCMLAFAIFIFLRGLIRKYNHTRSSKNT